MTRRLSVLKSTKFAKPAQTKQAHQTQTWNCTKYLKKITRRCRM